MDRKLNKSFDERFYYTQTLEKDDLMFDSPAKFRTGYGKGFFSKKQRQN